MLCGASQQAGTRIVHRLIILSINGAAHNAFIFTARTAIGPAHVLNAHHTTLCLLNNKFHAIFMPFRRMVWCRKIELLCCALKRAAAHSIRIYQVFLSRNVDNINIKQQQQHIIPNLSVYSADRREHARKRARARALIKTNWLD